MTKVELENLIRSAGELARERDFFLIGSQALRGVCKTIPKGFPKTIEADLYPRRYPQAWAILRNKLGKGSPFFRRNGYYLDCTDPALSTIPDGWMDRLIPFRTPRTGGITAWCLEPHDLFVSKLVAWREKDQAFLKGMLLCKLAKPAVLLERIEDLPIPASGKEDLTVTLSQLMKECALELRAKHRKK